MRHWLPELVAAPLYPWLRMQGKRARRVTPRLPEAPAPYDGTGGTAHAETPLTLLAIGESPVAGVGVASHEEGITGQFAQALADALQRPVRWQARGRNGATVREAMDVLLPTLPAGPVDVAFVAFGVNDTTAFRSAARWRADLDAFLQAVDQRCMPRLVVVSGVPQVGRFPALPQPLRWVMGLKASVLDRTARDLARARPRTLYVSLAIDTNDPGLMASDGFHPSAAGCRTWAAMLVAEVAPHLRMPLTA